jgi:uncharacterized protein (TIGR02246 family)
MRTARIALAVSAAVLAIGLTTASAQTKDAALDKLVADWSAAFAKGDAKTLASLYTENAIRVSPDGGRVVGRDAIAKEFATAFAGPWKGANIKIQIGALQPLGADIAIGEGTYEVMATGPDGKPLSVKGNYVNTLVKKNGAWVLASNAAVLPAPPPSAPAK